MLKNTTHSKKQNESIMKKKIFIIGLLFFSLGLSSLYADQISDCLELETLKAEKYDNIAPKKIAEISKKICSIRAKLGWDTDIANDFYACMKSERAGKNKAIAYPELVEDSLEVCNLKLEAQKDIQKTKEEQEEKEHQKQLLQIDKKNRREKELTQRKKTEKHNLEILCGLGYQKQGNTTVFKNANGDFILSPAVSENTNKKYWFDIRKVNLKKINSKSILIVRIVPDLFVIEKIASLSSLLSKQVMDNRPHSGDVWGIYIEMDKNLNIAHLFNIKNTTDRIELPLIEKTNINEAFSKVKNNIE